MITSLVQALVRLWWMERVQDAQQLVDSHDMHGFFSAAKLIDAPNTH